METAASLLFVGANGYGKIWLGTWSELQSPQKEKVHKISVQKSLTMPDTTTPISIDRAEKDLLFGNADGGWAHKQGHRWQRKPAISLFNDYQKPMVCLFSDHTEESVKYLSASWEWEVVEDDDSLPDELLIEVLGGRKPVVFVEGESGSFDLRALVIVSATLGALTSCRPRAAGTSSNSSFPRSGTVQVFTNRGEGRQSCRLG